MKARAEMNANLRVFKIPEINFACESYLELVDWATTPISEPPVTRGLTEEEIDAYMDSDDAITFPEYPCHTQAVERYVQVVCSSQKVSEPNVDGYIKNKIQSRKTRPKFETKSDYKM